MSEHLSMYGWWLLWGLFAILMLRLPARTGHGLGHDRRLDQIELRRQLPKGDPVLDDAGPERRASDEVQGGPI